MGHGRHGGGAVDPEKKDEWGLVREIKGHRLEEEQKVDIVVMTEWAKEKGVSVSHAWNFLRSFRRGVYRWRKKLKEESDLRNQTPGPEDPLHRLWPPEREVVLEIARKEEYADLAHRTLTLMAWDLNLFFLSFSSVFRILHPGNLIGLRRIKGIYIYLYLLLDE